MILLVTGGCGFIGSSFVNRVLRRHPDWHVRVLDRLTYAGSLERIDAEFRQCDRFRFLYGDILDRQIVEEAVTGVDVVVHFAAESHVSYSFIHGDLFADVNVRGTSILCETIVKRPVEKFVLISSSEVYGNSLRTPIDEDHPLNPRNPYAGSKAAADRLAFSYYMAFDLPLVIVRPFNNYGPFQHTEKVIPHFICAALQGRPLEIHDDGLQTRDWLYVEDNCEALEEVVEGDIRQLKGQVINVGTGSEATVRAIAEHVVRQVGRGTDLRINEYHRPGQVRRQISSTQKAEELLGWRAKIPFETGLERTIRWYTDNERWWRSLISPAHPPAQAIAKL